MELALLESHRAGKVALPLLVTRLDQRELLTKFTVTSLEAPHRVADALFRDSLLDGTADSDRNVDLAARTALAALGLAAGTLARSDVDLRSRRHLFAEQKPIWALLDRPGEAPKKFELDADSALDLLKQAIAAAKGAGLPWEGEVELTPSPDLVELVRRSQELASASGAADD